MLYFSVIALTLPSLIFSWSITDLFDGKCDQFDNQEKYCAANSRFSPWRTYSSWTRYDQSVRLDTPVYTDLPKKCHPIMFYMMSRHSVRYPRPSDIKLIDSVLPKLKEDLSTSYYTRTDELCSADYHQIQKWSQEINAEQSGHITPNGYTSTKEIAKQFYFRYPNLFNPKYVNFRVGTTSRNRTIETAQAFIDGIAEMEPAIREKASINSNDFLEFNMQCLKKIGFRTPKASKVMEITDSNLFQKLRARLGKRMGFQYPITNKQLDAMYRACSIEQAINYASPWCTLFTRMELNALETRSNIADFYENGPGSKLPEKNACPVISNLYQAVQQAVRNPETRNTYLYFTHASAMSRLWTIFGLFGKLDLDGKFCPNSQYEWQTSRILPFNANFDAVLYRCSPDPDTSNPADFKLLTMVNGNPVKIAKCGSAECGADKFLKEYKQLARNCDLESMCPSLDVVKVDDVDDDDD